MREGVGREREVREKIILIFFSLRFFFRSMKIGPQVFVGTEGKVDLRNESYALTPKSLSFVKLHEVENFTYLCYFYPKGYLMIWNWLRGRERP